LVRAKSLTESPIQLSKKLTENETNIVASSKGHVENNIQIESGGFHIENFLQDSEWRSLVKQEFSKGYFMKINEFLEKEYQRGIVRPPKELVFNAFNSCQIRKVTNFIF
jgi:hypothetical protein